MDVATLYNRLESKQKSVSYLTLILNRWPRNRYEAALRFIAIHKGDTVLDVGCGKGDLLNYIQTKTDRGYGVDISKQNLRVAKKLLSPVVKLSLQDINSKTNFPNNFFDVILLTDVIEHTIDRYSLFIELKRILKLDGIIVIVTPNIAKIKNRLRLLVGKYPYTSDVKSDVKEHLIYDGGHIQWFTFKTLRDLSKQFDFDIIKLFGYGRFGKFHNIYPSLLSGSMCIILKNNSKSENK